MTSKQVIERLHDELAEVENMGWKRYSNFDMNGFLSQCPELTDDEVQRISRLWDKHLEQF